MKYLNLLTIIVILLSCDSRQDKSSVPQKYLTNIDLLEKGSMYLLLDSETTPNIGETVIYKADSSNYLVFFNSNNYMFYFYNLKTTNLEKKIKFDKDGPNGLGSRIASFLIEDDKFLIHSYYSNEILTADFNGNVLKRFKIDIKSDEIYPNSNRKMPLTKINDVYFLYTGQSCNSKNIKETKSALLQITQDGQRLLAEFPELYSLESDAHYWPSGFCDISFTKGSNNQLYFSYTLDKNLYSVSDSDQIVQSHQILMNDIEIDESPVLKKSFDQDPRREQSKIFARTRFSSLYYEEYRKVFIRRIDEPIIERSNGKMQSSSKLQIIDENFNILGYSEIKGKDHFFFTDKGMYQIIFSTQMEDSLKIKHYEYSF